MNKPEQYVIEAYERIKKSPSPKMTDHIHKFICDCVGLLPASYGPFIQNKIIRDLKAVSVKSVKQRGDFRKNKTYFEFKTSFLSKGVSYSITNIRGWHDFHYYVLCFIDVENNFTPNFYVITKNGINNFSQRSMNGTVESNIPNVNVGMRVTLDIKSKEFQLLQSMNLLKDTSFDSLFEFIDSFKMKKDKSVGCKFKFNGVDFNSDNVTENYIKFLKYFILTTNNFGTPGVFLVQKSLGKFFSFNAEGLSKSCRKKKQYEEIFKSCFVSTYTSTQKKITHINKILNSFPYELQFEFYN
jgi:hypothetical protein